MIQGLPGHRPLKYAIRPAERGHLHLVSLPGPPFSHYGRSEFAADFKTEQYDWCISHCTHCILYVSANRCDARRLKQ